MADDDAHVAIVKDVHPAPYLTPDELTVLEHLADATNAFARLPEHHPTDIADWAHDVHHLQARVMARAAIRAYPDQFTPLETRPRRPTT